LNSGELVFDLRYNGWAIKHTGFLFRSSIRQISRGAANLPNGWALNRCLKTTQKHAKEIRYRYVRNNQNNRKNAYI
jgi:hypothetical protein